MIQVIRIGLISFILMVSLAGTCLAEDTPGYLLYLQGGESSVTNGSDGAQVVTIKDIIPYLYQKAENSGFLIPATQLVNTTTPLKAALIRSGTGNESVSLVEISNLSLSEKELTLTLKVGSPIFYEGELLKPFASESTGLVTEISGVYTTGLYLEISGKTPDNRYVR
jgi:hypothetical protein